MLVVFPLGLLTTAVLFDVLEVLTDKVSFRHAAAHTMAAGLIGGAAAAVPGWVDWVAIPPGTRAKRIGLLHGLGNTVMLGLFLVSWMLRLAAGEWDASGTAVALGAFGLLVTIVTAWLGGELVERLAVGVDDDAGLDAPSSLSSRRTARAAQSRSTSATP